MPNVRITESARSEFELLPVPIAARVLEIFERLTKWPDVSGTKALRGKLAGSFRVRTGAYRVLFRVDRAKDEVVVWKLDNRKDVYED
jgi:mRNA-degrading endonuclease RelE of RelBE toxin-antitoxin system